MGRQRASLKKLNYLKVWRRAGGWLVGGNASGESNRTERTNRNERTERIESAGLVLVGWFGGGGAPPDFKII